jgi:hypothetical protein
VVDVDELEENSLPLHAKPKKGHIANEMKVKLMIKVHGVSGFHSKLCDIA